MIEKMIRMVTQFEEAKQAIFEEAMQTTTLGAYDIVTALSLHLIPYMVWNDINLGARRRQVFMRAFEVTDMLVGQSGTVIYVGVLGRDEFTAQTADEGMIDQNGYTKTKIEPAEIYVEIGDVIYNATKISDILREDSTLPWVRASLQKMGESVAYRMEVDMEAALQTGGVLGANIVGAATAGTLRYNDIIDVMALMSTDSYYYMGEPFLLFINPEQEADLLKDIGQTAFGTAAAIARPDEHTREGQPITGLYPRIANCVPLVTEVERDHWAKVVIPPTHPFGPAAIFAWKRHLKAESWRDEQYGRDVWLLSTRYGMKAKETQGIGLISNC